MKSKIPIHFPYRTLLKKQRPVHTQEDLFSHRHPKMPLSQRAKIFAPFDALKGYRDRLKEVDHKMK